MIPGYQVAQPKRGARSIIKMAIVLILLAAIAFFVYAWTKINRPQSSVSVPVTMTVEKGSGTSQIAQDLKDNDLISSAKLFVAYSFIKGANGKIQAGQYELDKKMTMSEIMDVLTNGKVSSGNEKRFTVIEGWTNAQIASHLEQRGITTEDKFNSALKADYDFKFSAAAKAFGYQGFLFPDTYEFHADWSDEDRVNSMLKNFDGKFTQKMLTDMESKNLTIQDTIIMASIIEREVGRSSSVKLTDDVLATMQQERANVASVFYNRLNVGMPLQSDATVNYVTGKSDRQPLYSDLEVDSKYNTYKYTGLPPGPISNPGLGSIMAAIYPAQTNYIYFISKSDGEAVFAATLEEHNENKAKYLK